MLDPGQVQVNHRENRSCQRWGALPCREAGNVAGIEVAEGGFRGQPGSSGAVLGSGERTGTGAEQQLKHLPERHHRKRFIYMYLHEHIRHKQ